MYWGSVKFFKHLIVTMLLLLFLGSIVLFSFLFYSNSGKSKEIDELSARISSLEVELELEQAKEPTSEPEPLTQEELCEIIEEDPVIMESILGELYNRHGRMFMDIVAGKGSKLPDYSNAFEDMYVTPADEYIYEKNTVYLTFDDGPSKNTNDILNILAKYDIKATFFVTGHNDNETNRALMKRIVDEGHSIGVHTYSHDYIDIYADVESYLADFYKMWQTIYEATGVKTEIFRFAGGSVNAYNYDIYIPIIAEMQRRGFRYFDWNVASNDADKKADWISMYNDVIKDINKVDRAVVLFHDGVANEKTTHVVEDVIIEILARGKRFDRITKDTMPLTFSYID